MKYTDQRRFEELKKKLISDEKARSKYILDLEKAWVENDPHYHKMKSNFDKLEIRRKKEEVELSWILNFYGFSDINAVKLAPIIPRRFHQESNK